ncbi:hypothetical protein L6164_021181 [Bauhinia variegata]|uniref:Uncharacterized protein n=1 Tax=Bauhinia variegata TaxID=167791 RepID=A0ACB9MXB4_BAUVA|nr:hypothetical protein L6164_021181 [Bauhinia variegata]
MKQNCLATGTAINGQHHLDSLALVMFNVTTQRSIFESRTIPEHTQLQRGTARTREKSYPRGSGDEARKFQTIQAVGDARKISMTEEG